MSTSVIYNEDCLETIRDMQDNSLDLVITSPPYYNARDYSQYISVADYMSCMKCVFGNLLKKLKPNRMCAINISVVLIPREKRSKQSYRIPLPFYFVPMMEQCGYEFLEDIIWEKPDGTVPNRNGAFYQHRKPRAYKPNSVTEYILIFKKPSNKLLDNDIFNHSLVTDDYERTNVWRIHPESNKNHPAVFPEKLASNVIKYYSYENELVYDPFCGSGTSAVVSKKLNRNFIGSELNKEYWDYSLKRVKLE